MDATIRTDHNDTVIVKLDKPRQLRLGHKAIREFMALTGCTVDSFDEAAAKYENLETLYYCMMHVDDPTVTMENVGDLLDHAKPGYLITNAGRAMVMAFGPEETEENPTA